MKRSLIIILLVFTNLITAQIKIGDNPQTLDVNSLLELESNSKALIISRVSEADMLAITPLQGAIVYNTDASCIFYYDGTIWNNLCSDNSTSSIAWGDITGDITTQTDLTTTLENYVDISTNQVNIAGEKTFTNKLTVNTGTLTDQAAEFFGRVKGENGTEDEDFVTKEQLDAVTAGGITGTQGSIFFANDAGVHDENNTNLFWNNNNSQLKVGSFTDDMETYQVFTDDLTTLNIQGSVSKPIDNATVLTEEHHTIIINWPSASITLPDPSTCYGRIYIIKINTDNVDIPITNFSGYEDSESENKRFFPDNKVTQIQSTGYRWEQIN